MLPPGGDIDLLLAPPTQAVSPDHSDAAPRPQNAEENESTTELSRSASFTHIPEASQVTAGSGIKRTFSENVLALPADSLPNINGSAHSANKQLFRRASRKVKKRLSVTKPASPFEDPLLNGTTAGDRGRPAEISERPKTPSRSVADTLKSFARKKWMSSQSRSPSPSRKAPKKSTESNQNRSPTKRMSDSIPSSPTIVTPSTASRSSSRSLKPEDDEIPPVPDLSARNIASHSKSPAHSLSALSANNKSDSSLGLSRASSALSLQSMASSDRLKIGGIKVPPIPSSISTDRLSAASADINKRKDPLWSAFRLLEGDFQKFQSKSSSLKANVIRTCLLSFLSRNATHPSNKTLRAEDLDRRIVILNKWWIGLLEMLNGRNNQSISATDRPTFLEGVTAIMTRPEWRVPQFPSSSPVDTPPSQQAPIPKSRSTASFDSNESEILAESIYQNVRNLFIQNLLSQMAFVVDKMSMRSAPASLVSFCGKACAYAFFFCPGVADVLVRLWHVPPDSLRRIFNEFGVSRGTDLGVISKQIADRFPPPLRSLSVTSPLSLTRHLQVRTPLPLGAGHIRWFGPWVNRWTGRDSDLFFVFSKYFHMLVTEFLPLSTERKHRACVPGLVPVHAQMLTILETTLYRQAHQVQPESFVSSTTEDLDKPDASAPLPMTLANAARSMAENRLIMLLRDLLADSEFEYEYLKEIYAESFDGVVKAAARKVSLYNNDACFVLCDFMEEVLAIMSRYHQSRRDTPILDWKFWLQVYKRMMSSENTLTQIRMITFLYTTWNILTSNEDRRRELCLDWLLHPIFFEKHFQHWSPMVRHYYLRLLCWRIARYDGDASELDIQILEALANRLNSSWAHYQYLRAEAEMLDNALPSSAPCSPAPARGLVIIRTDYQPLLPNLLASFDKIVPTSSTNQSTSYKSHSSLLNNIPPADSPTQNRKRWSIIKTLLGTPGNSRPGEVTPPRSGNESPTSTDKRENGTVSSRGGPQTPRSRPATPPYQPLSFKFSLEWQERPVWPVENKILSSPMLPASAQILLQMHEINVKVVDPKKPTPANLRTSKYAGRALAEWALIVTECQNFFERRKDEGVPHGRLVETPTLGVESFRMY